MPEPADTLDAGQDGPADSPAAGPGPAPRAPRRADWTVAFHLLAVAATIFVFTTVTLLVEEATANARIHFALHALVYASAVIALAALARFRPSAGAIVALPVIALWGVSVGPIGPGGAVVSLAVVVVACRAVLLARRATRRGRHPSNG